MPDNPESAIIKLLKLKLLLVFIFIIIMKYLRHINHGTGKFETLQLSTSRLQELKSVGYWGGM
jgi:hypothetical protein